MSLLNLENINKWIGDDLVAKIQKQRIKNGEIKRKRKLGTTELLWIFLNIATYSATRNLHEIIKRALADLNGEWHISVWGFCKARMRFSPPSFIPDLGGTRQKA